MIRNFRSQDWTCLIDLNKETNTVALKETVVRRVRGETFARGFYINRDGFLIGIAASPDGPLLFTSRGAYLLEEGDYLFKLVRDKQINIFSFTWKGRDILEQRYVRTLFRERKGWIDDKLTDFFAWMYTASRRRNFHSFYTVSYPLMDNDSSSFDLIVPLNR